MRRREPRTPRPTAPDSMPNVVSAEPERASHINELLTARGLERPQIDAWWGLRVESNSFRSRTEMWEAGEFDEVEAQAHLHAN